MKTSIVVTSKNDNYGGHLSLRASYALSTMINNYDEVVYVDWCSDNDISLIETLNIPKVKKLKHIKVLKSDVEKINPLLLEIPMIEVLGRNIGVRRSTGDWIVSSNIDIMPDSVNVLNLDMNKVYAVSRRNVPIDVTLTNKFKFFNYLKDNKYLYQKAPQIAGVWGGRADPWSLTVCCGDFQLAHRDLWFKMKGFEEAMIYRDCADTNLMKKSLIYGSHPELLDLDIFHLDHDGHFLSVGGKSIKNSWDKFVKDFTETNNSDDWGFANYSFIEEII
jgi:hypothetical protein